MNEEQFDDSFFKQLLYELRVILESCIKTLKEIKDLKYLEPLMEEHERELSFSRLHRLGHNTLYREIQIDKGLEKKERGIKIINEYFQQLLNEIEGKWEEYKELKLCINLIFSLIERIKDNREKISVENLEWIDVNQLKYNLKSEIKKYCQENNKLR